MSAGFSSTPVLEGSLARLEPLSPEHASDLAQAVAVDDLWRTWYTRIPSPEQMSHEIASRLSAQHESRVAPWAIIDARTGAAVGMTTYLNLDPTNRRLEIGSTWIGKAAQRSGINADAKRMLLGRAFDDLGCMAVEFRTHWHNHQSRAAIARLGAKQDGVLRNHIVWRDGTVRDTVVFSILDTEWPTVRLALEQRLLQR